MKTEGEVIRFGALLRELRLRAGFGLRRFASLIEMKPSNLCDIEYGRRSMPEEHLEPVASALGLEKGSDEWDNFFQLACKENNLPADVRRVANRKLVPALLRTIENAQLTDQQIQDLIHDLQGGRHSDERPD
jgi:transcriptional regulator with XRE-family HTH domain